MKKSNISQNLCLVTGANGFTGRFVCRELKKRNISFIALARPNSNTYWLEKRKYNIRFADINNQEQLIKAMIGCSHLINVASIGFGAAPVIIKACKNAGIKRAIFVSTTAVFTKLNAKSKNIRLKAEEKILKSKLKYTIIRPTMIFGTLRDRNIIRLIEWVKRYPIIPVFQKGEALQQPVFVEDVASAIVNSLENENSINQIFNIAGAKPLKFSEMIDCIAINLNKKILKVSINSKLAIILLRVLKFLRIRISISQEQVERVIEDKYFSNEKAEKLINYKPKLFEEVIKNQIKNFLENKN